MKYHVTQLDGRYSHTGSFGYVLEFSKNTWGTYSTGVLDFDRARRWMNRTYGWSQDVELYDKTWRFWHVLKGDCKEKSSGV
jgi:hypothetical protein